jgi:hypothetical protein
MLEEGKNHIRDTAAPFLVTVTIGLYGYEANNGIRGCVPSGESPPKLVLVRRPSKLVYAGQPRQLVLAVSPRSETSAQCSSISGIREADSAILLTVTVMCAAVNLQSE